jgi:Ca2+-binding EF-hand superfamily protein
MALSHSGRWAAGSGLSKLVLDKLGSMLKGQRGFLSQVVKGALGGVNLVAGWTSAFQMTLILNEIVPKVGAPASAGAALAWWIVLHVVGRKIFFADSLPPAARKQQKVLMTKAKQWEALDKERQAKEAAAKEAAAAAAAAAAVAADTPEPEQTATPDDSTAEVPATLAPVEETKTWDEKVSALSPEDRAMFATWDVDRDGTIDFANMRGADTCQDWSDGEIQAVMSKADTNGDGNIDPGEFVGLMKELLACKSPVARRLRLANYGMEASAKSSPQMRKQLAQGSHMTFEQNFAAIDSDGDGRIDFGNLRRSAICATWSDDEVTLVLEKADRSVQ